MVVLTMLTIDRAPCAYLSGHARAGRLHDVARHGGRGARVQSLFCCRPLNLICPQSCAHVVLHVKIHLSL